MIHPIKHFLTITHHRHLVIKFGYRTGIFWQSLRHDLSKYSPTEFCVGAKYYNGKCSPNVEEIRRNGYSQSWLHHSGRNKHHFEYWTVFSKVTKSYVSIKMPIKYVKEMLCDHLSATMVYNGKNYDDSMPLDYFNTRNEKYGMHPETAELLETWLKWIEEYGYKEALKRIKEIKEY